jgi:hypothetical protein
VAQVIEEDGVAAAIWKKHVVSLLFTYRCTLACRHCCFNCSPRKPPVLAPREDALEYLRQLHAVDRVVHIAGGEAMMVYPELLDLCRAAGGLGIAPHFIETNATFATSDGVTYERLTALREAGVQGLLVSADPYHQEWCPPERQHRCVRIAREVFGARNVAAGDRSLAELRRMRTVGCDPALRAEHVRREPPCCVGRAGHELAALLPDRPIEQLRDGMWHGGEGDPSCRLEFDPETIWEVHIDPYGNFQTCCGIVLGNAQKTPLPDLLARGFLGISPVIDAVYQGGPQALLSLAVERGYRPREGYPQRCALCWEVRQFLRPFFPDVLAPDEVYLRDPAPDSGLPLSA